MRVLPEVRGAAFDVPSETFVVELAHGADGAPVRAAIAALGFTPEVLEGPPPRAGPEQRLASPTAPALRGALERARARGVPLVVSLGGRFCAPCRVFEETTLGDPRVQALLAGFEFLKVDVEQDPAAARDLDVHGVPDLRVLAPDGTVRARHNGLLLPAEFVAFLTGLAR